MRFSVFRPNPREMAAAVAAKIEYCLEDRTILPVVSQSEECFYKGINEYEIIAEGDLKEPFVVRALRSITAATLTDTLPENMSDLLARLEYSHETHVSQIKPA